MNTIRVNTAAGVILAAQKQGKVLAASLAMALESARLLQSPESAAESSQLYSDLTGAKLARWEEEQENAQLRARVDEVERAYAFDTAALKKRIAELGAGSPWERAVTGLNALVDADVIFHVEPDGHISAPFSDEHIEWDLKAKRWVLTHDEDEEDTTTPRACTDCDGPNRPCGHCPVCDTCGDCDTCAGLGCSCSCGEG